ncbi:MAG: GNAT family N-acetyltransferase [Oscillospiraceae bacterium]|nr:GNAT family N-acetyltransferase [Oscillospiraceae bacterium]
MLKHKGTQTIKTPRLILRRFTVSDAQAMFDNWANDERVTRFLTWTPHDTPELTKKLLAVWTEAYDKPDTYNWAMELNGEVIGNISVVRISEQSEFADLGYCMGHEWWNKGIMTETVKAVIDYLFGEIGFNRISISHAVKNPGSGCVAQKCGMTYEGTQRQLYKAVYGEFLDIAHYAILREEWKDTIR